MGLSPETGQRGASHRVDFGDDLAMAALRARVFGGLQLLSVSASGVGILVDPAFRHSGTAPWATIFDLATGVWLVRRGRSLSDRWFLGFLLFTQAVAVSYLARVQTVGSAVPAEYGLLLAPTLVVAVFFNRRRYLVVQAVWAVAGSSWLVWLRLGRTQDFAATILGEVFTAAVVAIVVRILRELADDALVDARRGEVTDPLTGLANRRGMERRGARQWQDRARSGQPIAVLILDIDRFKRVNDTQGHAAGDEVIRRVAALLDSSMRRDDVVVRLGGEEFLVLAAGEPGEGTVTAERLRAAVEREMRPVTVSVGVYEASPEVADDLPHRLWDAVGMADRAMYDAKRSGRNRVVAAITPKAS